MCGRIDILPNKIIDAVKVGFGVEWESRENRDLRPTQQVDTLQAEPQGFTQVRLQWGIQPSWSKQLLINAQAETVATKMTFREAFRSRRCVIPCSGWYEWKILESGQKQKFRLHASDESTLFMAAIWFAEKDSTNRLVTLTTQPTPQCAPIHHRMPLLLPPVEVSNWLNRPFPTLEPLLRAPLLSLALQPEELAPVQQPSLF
ncbi:MAG: SOS response-associated peptidase [Deltaproteobacteria bacterium]|jgi:putative SOS response-associated peptidase YedK|nr:SOS response-associated peptidase [Deltaproteobacteria bacterium]MBT7205239.1 SOS response-associated peptidase [Deltaproteobacteria bacterium]